MLPSLSCRYSRKRRTPNTALPPTPLPTLASLPTPTSCDSFNKLLLPAKHTPAGHRRASRPTPAASGRQHTRAGKDSHSIMIVIIIIISIR